MNSDKTIHKYHTFGCSFAFKSFYFYSLFFFLSSCSFFETKTNYCYFLSTCWIFSSCFEIWRGANFIPLLSAWTLLAAHPPVFTGALGSSCFLDDYLGGSMLRGASFRLAPVSWVYTAIAAQALCLNTGFYSPSVVFLVPNQLVAGFFAAIYCSFFSASSILSSWAVFWIGLNVVLLALKFELVKLLAAV